MREAQAFSLEVSLSMSEGSSLALSASTMRARWVFVC